MTLIRFIQRVVVAGRVLVGDDAAVGIDYGRGTQAGGQLLVDVDRLVVLVLDLQGSIRVHGPGVLLVFRA
jgi:hypothetical protein